MGGGGSGGSRQGSVGLGRRKGVTKLRKRTFETRRVLIGPLKGAAYTLSTIKEMAPVTFAWFFLQCSELKHTAAAAGFCTMMLSYVLARFGDNDAACSYLPADVLGECKTVIHMSLMN